MARGLQVGNAQVAGGGVGKIWIKIADLTISLVGDSPGLKLGVEGAMHRFLVGESASDVQLRAGWADLHPDQRGEMLFDSGGLWQLFCQNGIYCFRFTSPVIGPLPYKTAAFDPRFTAGEVSLHRPYFSCDRPVYPLEYPLDELLMIHLLAGGKGAEVHACGVLDASQHGQLFVGQSGAGKTTMATLWQQAAGSAILSDDRIMLRHLEGRFWIYGTPWHGEAGLACPARAPLTRIYFLRHGRHNQVVRQTASEALGRLFACSFPPFYDPEALDFTLGFLQKVVTTVPCDELRFLPDQRVVEFIRQQTA
jgi:hypothetical protein